MVLRADGEGMGTRTNSENCNRGSSEDKGCLRETRGNYGAL